MRRCLGLALAMLTLAACGGTQGLQDEELLMQRAAGLTSNGMKYNGLKFNGLKYNGTELAGMLMSGATLGGASLADVKLVGTSFSGRRFDGSTISGLGWKGVRMTGAMMGGGSVTIVLHDIVQTEDPDILEYKLKWEDTDGSLRDACGSANGQPIPAVPVHSWWLPNGTPDHDPTHFTFACKGVGALAKCLYMGYKPWKTVAGVSLARYHHACTRMIRGDYCGDGQSHTHDGRVINVFDRLGMQVDDTASYPKCEWTFDAEWDENGATCITSWRTTLYVNQPVSPPPCFQAKFRADCGNGAWSGGALIADKTTGGSKVNSMGGIDLYNSYSTTQIGQETTYCQ